jgi:hypothetical protein
MATATATATTTTTTPPDQSSKSNMTTSKQPLMAFICPKELDILPPRPVLFPWIPPMENLNLNLNNCCGGGGDTTKKNHRRGSNRFSFDLGGGSSKDNNKDSSSSSSQPGTPVTLPLSPSELSSGNNNNNNNDDDIEIGIPDMSNHNTSSVRNYQTPHRQNNKNQQLVSLEDVIAQVLRVLFVFLSMKRAVLGESSEDEEQQQQRLAETFRFQHKNDNNKNTTNAKTKHSNNQSS